YCDDLYPAVAGRLEPTNGTSCLIWMNKLKMYGYSESQDQEPAKIRLICRNRFGTREKAKKELLTMP
ncbi:MAG: hypothetical protein J7L19_03210, partial [Dehalococcoidia bacterium]|nr:hypothetical protein [Dehalococcoidia bacterium]